MINITEFREMLGEEYLNHKEYTFYYDETNNYKKLRINENGLNVNEAFEKNYVLGGFVCLKEKKEIVNESIEELINKKLIKYKNGELKASKLFKDCKTFLECLNKWQVQELLKWIINNGFIHYSTMNCFYYGIVDLVESFLIDKDKPLPFPKEYIDIMKCEVYNLINYFYRDEFIRLANEIEYPNVKGENVKKLCNWLIEKIDSVNGREDFEFELLRQLIKSKRNASNLIFLEDNEEKTIVDNFYASRQERCIIFSESEHIFDEEPTEEELMKKNPLTKDGKTVFINYTFEDSKSHRLIQVSDIVVSLIGKLFDYIENNFIEKIENDIKNLNDIQKENFKFLITLINKSLEEDSFFAVSINSMDFNRFRYDSLDFIERLIDKR